LSIRTVLGLYIHDAELASMFHHEPLLRHDAIVMVGAADDDLFNAKTSEAWFELLQLKSHPTKPLQDALHINKPKHDYTQPMPQELVHRSSRFTGYVILQGLLASICEAQQAGNLAPTTSLFQKYLHALLCWNTTFMLPSARNPDLTTPDTFCLTILWHNAFMNLLADFNSLERAVGRDGPETAAPSDPVESDILYATQWATSLSARRCILHAYAMQNALGTMRLDDEPPIHVPHCLFLAGIACYCYTLFGRSTSQATRPDPGSHTNAPALDQPDLDFPEFNSGSAAMPSHLFKSLRSGNYGNEIRGAGGQGQHDARRQDGARPVVPVGVGLLFTLTDMLQRIGHWGISRRFATILSTLVHTYVDEDWMLAS
jgi:hypothetical protein